MCVYRYYFFSSPSLPLSLFLSLSSSFFSPTPPPSSLSSFYSFYILKGFPYLKKLRINKAKQMTLQTGSKVIQTLVIRVINIHLNASI